MQTGPRESGAALLIGRRSFPANDIHRIRVGGAHPGGDGAVLLSFIVDHADPGLEEEILHLLRGGGGGEVDVVRLLPQQEVADGAAGDAQLVLLLGEQACDENKRIGYIVPSPCRPSQRLLRVW